MIKVIVTNSGKRIVMIDFDEELKNFKPSMEISEAEDAIRDKDLTDMIDILKEITESQSTVIRQSAAVASAAKNKR